MLRRKTAVVSVRLGRRVLVRNKRTGAELDLDEFTCFETTPRQAKRYAKAGDVRVRYRARPTDGLSDIVRPLVAY